MYVGRVWIPSHSVHSQKIPLTQRAALKFRVALSRKGEGANSDAVLAKTRTAGGCDRYSGTTLPDPPSSAGKSLSFGKPSFIGSTVSA